MRVIECDECGDTVTAANDDELVRHLGEHLRSEHGRELSEDQLRALIDREAYDAMDS
jgi:predicted small metal-binding protein